MSDAMHGERRGHPAAPPQPLCRKRLMIDQKKLDRLTELLCPDTETEVVDKALDLLLQQAEAMVGLRKLAGRGHEIDNLFDPHLDP